MVNRMLNGGIQPVDGVDMLELLRAVVANVGCPPEIREDDRFPVVDNDETFA
jgi:hypothetical protein